MLVIATFAWAGEAAGASPASGPVYQGQVLEVKDTGRYTYLRIKTKDGETWAAVNRAAVKPGDKVTIENVTVMNNFESKSLNKTFSTVVFGTLRGSGGGNGLPAGHPSTAKAVDAEDIHVPKASGANAKTVEEINTRSADLKDQVILVRGKVVKYAPGIMGKNWIHLRDGTGSGTSGTNDIVVTTTSETKTGDIVTAKGIVRTAKDFGSGYSYKVLIEEATLQP
jgi:hypothetical protein